MAFLWLKEKIRLSDIVMLVLTMIGLFGVVLGGDGHGAADPPPIPMYLLYIGLIANPILSGWGTVVMRKMKKSGDAVVSWYLQWAMLFTCLIIMLGEGVDSFHVFTYFDVWAWVICFFTGATSVYSETLRFKALKLHKASPLQKLFPLTILFQWIFDITLFGIHYSYIQDGSLAYLFLVYLVHGLWYVCVDSKKKEELLEKNDLMKSIKASVVVRPP